MDLKIIYFVFISIIALNITSCSEGEKDKTPASVAPKKKSFHGEVKTTSSPMLNSPILADLKKNFFKQVSSTKTIGEAFDSYKYAAKKEWRETPVSVENGPYYIDYICWLDSGSTFFSAFKDGAVKKGLDIKFVIHADGEISIAMASRLVVKSDGTVQTSVIDPAEINKTVTDIYENREISF